MSTNWVSPEEFAVATGFSKEKIQVLVQNGSLKTKKEGQKVLIELQSGTDMVLKRNSNSISTKDIGTDFAKKTINTIMNLHNKVLNSKDETLAALKSENQFLKEALFALQEDYDRNKDILESLQKQLDFTQKELELTKRKYKIIWGKSINLSKNKQ